MTSHSDIANKYFIGLMSGTSLDGVDAVLCQFKTDEPLEVTVLATHHLAYQENIKQDILALHHVGENELHRSAIVAQNLSRLYAESVNQIMQQTSLPV